MKLRNILHDVLNEALSLGQAKRYQSIYRSAETESNIDKIFNSLRNYKNFEMQSKRGDRLYFNVDFEIPKNIEDEGDPSVEYKGDMFDTFNEIRMFLGANDYEISLYDYKQGIAFDSKGKGIKIGKLIVKIMNTTNPSESELQYYKNLLTKYEKDKLRSKVSTSKLYMVISRAKYDIAGMSTGRGWYSCMSLNGGSNMSYVSCDVREGTIIAYLISKSDTNIQNPISRLNIKPFINIKDSSDVVYIPEDNHYGIYINGFYETLNNMFKDIQPGSRGIFKLHYDLTSDSVDTVAFGNFGDTITNDEAKGLVNSRRSQILIENLPDIKTIKDIYIPEEDEIRISYCDKLQTVSNVRCKGDIDIVHNKNLTTIKDVVSGKNLELNDIKTLKFISGKAKQLVLYHVTNDFLKNCNIKDLEAKDVRMLIFQDFESDTIEDIEINSNVQTVYIEDHRQSDTPLTLPEKIGSGNVQVHVKSYSPTSLKKRALFPDNRNYTLVANN